MIDKRIRADESVIGHQYLTDGDKLVTVVDKDVDCVKLKVVVTAGTVAVDHHYGLRRYTDAPDAPDDPVDHVPVPDVNTVIVSAADVLNEVRKTRVEELPTQYIEKSLSKRSSTKRRKSMGTNATSAIQLIIEKLKVGWQTRTTLAEAIVEYRKANGGEDKVTDLIKCKNYASVILTKLKSKYNIHKNGKSYRIVVSDDENE